MKQIETDIRRFIVDNFLFGRDDGSLKIDTSFLEAGVIDSTGVLELVVFIEETYGIQVEDEELVPENLDSIENLAHFVSGKRKKIGSGTPRRGL